MLKDSGIILLQKYLHFTLIFLFNSQWTYYTSNGLISVTFWSQEHDDWMLQYISRALQNGLVLWKSSAWPFLWMTRLLINSKTHTPYSRSSISPFSKSFPNWRVLLYLALFAHKSFHYPSFDHSCCLSRSVLQFHCIQFEWAALVNTAT